jgi:hypothetical protein
MALSSSSSIANDMVFSRHAVLACPPLAVPRRIFKESSGRGRDEGKRAASVEWFEVAAVQSRAPRARIPFLYDI